MSKLEDEGFISRQRGRGTIVLLRHTEPKLDAEPTGLVRYLAATLAATTVSVIDMGLVQPPEDVSRALRLSGSDLCLRVIRLRCRGELPILYTTMYVDKRLANMIKREDFVSASAAAVMIQQGYVFHKVSYSAGAALADSNLAGQLKVHVGSPLLELRRISIGRDDRPFEYVKIIGPPDRFQFDVTMQQNDDGDLMVVSGS